MRIFGQIVIILLSVWALIDPLEKCLGNLDSINSIEFVDSLYFLLCCLILLVAIRQFTREVPRWIWVVAIILLLFFSVLGIYFDLYFDFEIIKSYRLRTAPNLLVKFVYQYHNWLANYWRILLTLIITSVGINIVTEIQFRKSILLPEQKEETK